MVDQTIQTQITQVPEYISDRQQQVLNTLYGVEQVGQPGDPNYVAPKTGLLQLPQTIPQQLTAGLSPAQIQAMQMLLQHLVVVEKF